MEGALQRCHSRHRSQEPARSSVQRHTSQASLRQIATPQVPPDRQHGRLPQKTRSVVPTARLAARSTSHRVRASAGVWQSEILQKQVITLSQGKVLGVVDGVYMDPVSGTVVSLTLRAKGAAWGTRRTGCIPLYEVYEIGDVILVSSTDAGQLRLDELAGCMRLQGLRVQSAADRSLGKVCDFFFDPENGRLSTVRYNAVGFHLPVELRLLDLHECGAADIYSLRQGGMQLKSQASPALVSAAVWSQLPSLVDSNLSSPEDQAFQEWNARDGQAFAAQYQLAGWPWASREEFEALRARRYSPALPPGRSPATASSASGDMPRARRRQPAQLPAPAEGRRMVDVLQPSEPAWAEERQGRPPREALRPLEGPVTRMGEGRADRRDLGPFT